MAGDPRGSRLLHWARPWSAVIPGELHSCCLYRIIFYRGVWTLAAKMDDGAPWHKGVLQGAEKFMASWHKEEEEASRRRATKRDSRDLEPPTHL